MVLLAIFSCLCQKTAAGLSRAAKPIRRKRKQTGQADSDFRSAKRIAKRQPHLKSKLLFTNTIDKTMHVDCFAIQVSASFCCSDWQSAPRGHERGLLSEPSCSLLRCPWVPFQCIWSLPNDLSLGQKKCTPVVVKLPNTTGKRQGYSGPTAYFVSGK